MNMKVYVKNLLDMLMKRKMNRFYTYEHRNKKLNVFSYNILKFQPRT